MFAVADGNKNVAEGKLASAEGNIAVADGKRKQQHSSKENPCRFCGYPVSIRGRFQLITQATL